MSKNRKKTISPRQQQANQRNAQKSTGPKTQAGKEVSRYNALKHGITAELVCIPGECRPHYDARRLELIDYYKPQSLLEFDLVDHIANALWRKRRVVKHETLMVTLEVHAQRQSPNPRVTEASPDVESSVATQILSDDTNGLGLLDRYESKIDRSLHRLIRLLHETQANRPPATGPIPVYPFDSESTTGPEPAAAEQAPAPSEPAPNTESQIEASPGNGHLYDHPTATQFIVHRSATDYPEAPKPQPETSPVLAEPEKYMTAA